MALNADLVFSASVFLIVKDSIQIHFSVIFRGSKNNQWNSLAVDNPVHSYNVLFVLTQKEPKKSRLMEKC